MISVNNLFGKHVKTLITSFLDQDLAKRYSSVKGLFGKLRKDFLSFDSSTKTLLKIFLREKILYEPFSGKAKRISGQTKRGRVGLGGKAEKEKLYIILVRCHADLDIGVWI